MAKRQLTAQEKEALVVIYKERANCGLKQFCETVGVPQATFRTWLEQYEKHGPMGLERMGAETRGHLEAAGEMDRKQLVDMCMRLEVENERLKKNYMARRGEDGKMEYLLLKPRSSR